MVFSFYNTLGEFKWFFQVRFYSSTVSVINENKLHISHFQIALNVTLNGKFIDSLHEYQSIITHIVICIYEIKFLFKLFQNCWFSLTKIKIIAIHSFLHSYKSYISCSLKKNVWKKDIKHKTVHQLAETFSYEKRNCDTISNK